MVAKLEISVMGQRMFYTQKSSLLKTICLFYFLAKKQSCLREVFLKDVFDFF